MGHSSTEEIRKQDDLKKKKPIIIGLSILIIVIILIVACYKLFVDNDKIAKNIYIEGVKVAGMTKGQAYNALAGKFQPRDINTKYENNNYKIGATDIDLSYDIKGSVNEAYNFTKQGSFISNTGQYFNVWFHPKRFDLKINFNEDKLNKKLSEISSGINVKMKNASLSLDGGFSYKDSTTGKKFDTDVNKKAILSKINKMDDNILNLKVDLIIPKITLAQVKSVNSVLGTFSTNYGTSSPGRAHNVALAAKKTSNILLMPGEEFSYDKLTGQTNSANGFLNAPVIVYGKLKNSAGGGVCQTSTTIYNAALFAGLKITEVNNHSEASSYVPRGRDATVSDGGLNLRFKNPFNHPVFIKNSANGSTITSTIYGCNLDKQRIVINVKPIGSMYSTYRNYLDKSGKLIKSEHISNSKYKK